MGRPERACLHVETDSIHEPKPNKKTILYPQIPNDFIAIDDCSLLDFDSFLPIPEEKEEGEEDSLVGDMEALGRVSVRCYSVSGGGRFDAQSSKNIRAPASSSSSFGFREASFRRRSSGVVLGVSGSDYFRGRDHLDYYYNYSSGGGRGRCGKMISCGKRSCKVVDKEKETKEKKKMMKKRLKKMLRTQIQGGAGALPISPDSDPIDSFPDQVKVAKMVSDAAEVLLEQLQQLRAEGRDFEMRGREGFEVMMTSDSSSSESSESDSDSDSECGEVVTDIRRQQNFADPVVLQPEKPLEVEAFASEILVENRTVIPSAEAALISISTLENESTAATGQLNHSISACNLGRQSQCISVTSVMKSPAVAATVGVLSPSTKKVEVCMGGKCKKSGSVALLGKFQSLLGTEGVAVSGCKCMGRCREGPNVRISDDLHAKSLCIGVGLTDVDMIVGNYLAPSPEFGLNVA